MTSSALITALVGAVGSADVLVEEDVRGGFEVDWTGRFRGRAAAVVRPADAAEVSAVVRACREQETAIVPQGGNTGLVGGGVPRGEEVVVSLTRLDALSEIDHATGTVVAGAGVTLAALQKHARAHGKRAPVARRRL